MLYVVLHQEISMSKFVVVVFPNENRAYEGLQALRELHEEGSLTLYSDAVIQRGAAGGVVVKEQHRELPIGTGVAALVGGLAGVFAGPVGAAVGASAGAALGAARDLLNLGVSSQFINSTCQELAPGKTALVAEIAEEWVTPLDVRMAPIGGVVMREGRDDFIDDEIQKRIEKGKAELTQRRAELAARGSEKIETLKKHVSETEQALRAAADDASARMQHDREVAEAKILALQEQAKKTSADARRRIDERIAEIRADQKLRLGKLERAWRLTQEALRP
jgi:uncharacterized membrane protein